MDLKGQRFTVDLSDDEDDVGSESISENPALFSAFVGDVLERDAVAPPSAPTLKTTTTGFPEHKKRTRPSAFKQQRGASSKSAATASGNISGVARNQTPLQTNPSRLTQTGPISHDEERRRIDEENKNRLAAMSEEEIAEEREELMAGLNPSLIERLLKRANLDDGRGDTQFESIPDDKTEESNGMEVLEEDEKPVPAPKTSGKLVTASKSIRFEDDEPTNPIDLQPISQPFKKIDPHTVHPEMHFPTGPAAPELDPSDPSFLENLHTKYFPSLPADPSKLAWMAPIPTHGSIADQESSYYPGQHAVSASALRFDFRGSLLPPRIARAMPVSKGLHHHGDAPESAGYTIPELARLARSAFPAQRCIAFQTLGRFLFRLGKGTFGAQDSEIVTGLWQCVEGGKVIQTLEEAASATSGHQGSKVYATEAVWLWQRGGGKVWKAS